MIEVPLSKGKVALIDDEDAWITQWKWSFGGHEAVRQKKTNGKWGLVSMHRELCGFPKGMIVDHINHNTLDNRRSNLRVVTKRQNNMNRYKSQGKSSKYKGVCLYKARNKWVASIKYNGIARCLGYYENEKDAAAAYNQAANVMFGEYALLNEL